MENNKPKIKIMVILIVLISLFSGCNNTQFVGCQEYAWRDVCNETIKDVHEIPCTSKLVIHTTLETQKNNTTTQEDTHLNNLEIIKKWEPEPKRAYEKTDTIIAIPLHGWCPELGGMPIESVDDGTYPPARELITSTTNETYDKCTNTEQRLICIK